MSPRIKLAIQVALGVPASILLFFTLLQLLAFYPQPFSTHYMRAHFWAFVSMGLVAGVVCGWLQPKFSEAQRVRVKRQLVFSGLGFLFPYIVLSSISVRIFTAYPPDEATRVSANIVVMFLSAGAQLLITLVGARSQRKYLTLPREDESKPHPTK